MDKVNQIDDALLSLNPMGRWAVSGILHDRDVRASVTVEKWSFDSSSVVFAGHDESGKERFYAVMGLRLLPGVRREYLDFSHVMSCALTAAAARGVMETMAPGVAYYKELLSAPDPCSAKRLRGAVAFDAPGLVRKYELDIQIDFKEDRARVRAPYGTDFVLWVYTMRGKTMVEPEYTKSPRGVVSRVNAYGRRPSAAYDESLFTRKAVDVLEGNSKGLIVRDDGELVKLLKARTLENVLSERRA